MYNYIFVCVCLYLVEIPHMFVFCFLLGVAFVTDFMNNVNNINDSITTF